MLVFQSNWQHIKDRCCERAGMDPRWLVTLVAEINLYLPDDWRMTRRGNHFRVQVVGAASPALVGFSYRTDEDHVLHIIQSVFTKDMFDTYYLTVI